MVIRPTNKGQETHLWYWFFKPDRLVKVSDFLKWFQSDFFKNRLKLEFFWVSLYWCFYITCIHGYPWISMDIHGYPWISMDIHEYPWISMDIHGYTLYKNINKATLKKTRVSDDFWKSHSGTTLKNLRPLPIDPAWKISIKDGFLAPYLWDEWPFH